MIGSAISAVRSCYSPSHYYYAAHDKDGLGLWFLFGIAWIALFVLYGIGFYDLGDTFPDMFLASVGGKFTQVGFSLPIATHGFLVFSLITLILAFEIMLMLLNIAIIFAMVGVLMGLGLNATLNYMSILRITVYAQVAAYLVIIGLTMLLHRMGLDASWMRYTFIPLMLFYMGFGMYSAK